MKAEEVAIDHLIKKAQIQRFQENTLSEFVYNIRLSKYQERLNYIKQELPILESNLNHKKGHFVKKD